MRTLAIAVLFTALAGCDPCGPPGEPLVDAVIAIDAQISATDHLIVQMLNPQGEHLSSHAFATTEFGRESTYPMGDCDTPLQSSGSFTMRAWLSADRSATAPQPVEAQGETPFVVTCSQAMGCVAAAPKVRVVVARL